MLIEIIIGGVLVGGVAAIGRLILEQKNRQEKGKLIKIPVKKKP